MSRLHIQFILPLLAEAMPKTSPGPWFCVPLQEGCDIRSRDGWLATTGTNNDAHAIILAMNDIGQLLAIVKAASKALDHMDGNDVPEWLRESYLALGAAFAGEVLESNDKDQRAAAPAAPSVSPC